MMNACHNFYKNSLKTMGEQATRKRIEISGTDLITPVIRTILYFDIFNYPLELEEIQRFLGVKISREDLEDILESLVRKEYIFRQDVYYSMKPGMEHIHRRISGNSKAEQMLPKAQQRAELITRFPFVKAVFASGSLSKGYMDEKSDLDFFIVTTPGRLWVARILLVIYKRIFLGNSHKEFCVNYFIAADHLQIEEKNHFTATELATVIPLTGKKYYPQLMRENQWLFDFFPNYILRPTPGQHEIAPWYKKMLEWGLSLFGGKLLDNFCMWLTQKRWERLYRSSYSRPDFNVAFKSRKDVSKNHPRHFQKKVTDLLEEKWKVFAKNFSPESI
jgi:hypothetical protein